MKRLLLFVVLLLPIFLYGKSIKTTIVCDDKKFDVYEDSIISLKAYVDYNTYFLNVIITNKADERIYIEWENARMENEKILFPDDAPLTMGNERPNEALAKGAICKKQITSKYYYDSYNDRLKSIVNNKVIKKDGFQSISINIPIKYKDVSIDMPLFIRFEYK